MKIELSGLTGVQREFVRQFVKVGKLALGVVGCVLGVVALWSAWTPAGMAFGFVLLVAILAGIQTDIACSFDRCEEGER